MPTQPWDKLPSQRSKRLARLLFVGWFLLSSLLLYLIPSSDAAGLIAMTLLFIVALIAFVLTSRETDG